MTTTALTINSPPDIAVFVRERAGEHILRHLASLPRPAVEKAIVLVSSAIERAAAKNKKILQCQPSSIIQCAIQCATTGLYPGGTMPDCYLIPRGNVLTVMFSYRGMGKAAERSGCKSIRARPVFEGETFRAVEDMDGGNLTHEVSLTVDRTFENLLGVYVIGKKPDGTTAWTLLNKSQILKRRDAAGGGRSGPWKSWPLEMALKTALRWAYERGVFPLAEEFDAVMADADAIPEVRRRNAPALSPSVIDVQPMTQPQEPVACAACSRLVENPGRLTDENYILCDKHHEMWMRPDHPSAHNHERVIFEAILREVSIELDALELRCIASPHWAARPYQMDQAKREELVVVLRRHNERKRGATTTTTLTVNKEPTPKAAPPRIEAAADDEARIAEDARIQRKFFGMWGAVVGKGDDAVKLRREWTQAQYGFHSFADAKHKHLRELGTWLSAVGNDGLAASVAELRRTKLPKPPEAS